MKRYLSLLLLTGALLMSGCGGSDLNQISGLQENGVIVAPVCADDAYTTNEDTTLTVNAANGVLANDQPNGGIATFSGTSTQGGTVAGNADGGFTYTPPNGFTGTDTFTYTVTNTAGQATCTVTITVVAINGFFVDAVNGNDGTGSFTGGMPFQTIQAAVADAPTNADIVVLPGNYTGTVNLKDGQRLLGSGSTLVNPQGSTRPQLTGPVVLTDGNTLDFLRIENSPDDSVDGDNQNGGTITNCEIVTSGGEGVQVRPGTGTWSISNNTITNAVGLGVALQTTGAGQMTSMINSNTIAGSGFNAIGFTSENSSQLTAQVQSNTMTGNAMGATFEAFSFGTAVVCLDIESNTNDDIYVFDRSASATLEVEQLARRLQAKGAGNQGLYS